MNPIEKKTKMETKTDENKEEEEEENDDEQEEVLVALIEHRSKEVQHVRNRLTHYKSQLDETEKRLEDARLKLARIRSRNNSSNTTSNTSLQNNVKDIKLDKRSPSHEQVDEGSSGNRLEEMDKSSRNKDRLDSGSFGNTTKEIKHDKSSPSPARVPENSPINLIHSKPKPPQEKVKLSRNSEGLEIGSQNQSHSKMQFSSPSQKNNQPLNNEDTNGRPKQNRDLSRKVSPKKEAVASEAKGVKRKLEQKEHVDLIPHVRTKSSPTMIHCQTSSVISSQHKRKLRCLELCPTNDQLFATSALDGVVNLWQIQGRGSSANLLSSTDFSSAKQRRWPEDIAWHPEGSSLFAVYTADGGDTQISILNLNKTKEKKRVNTLVHKPHIKGIINNIMFMPWEDTCFVTGGSDHAVVLWSENEGENSWKPKVLHRNQHSSAVMGVAGIHEKKIVLSGGADKRIIGFDLISGRAGYKQQVESKCMSILPNPCDFNLFLVQTGTPERQVSLFDIRLRNTELHAFGWKQESSESQSALINQAWSPDGFYITSGSADPMIHIFDIRFNTRKPSQSIKAHQKRVFKAVWHYSMPLMISISSDLNIELHKVT